MNFEQLSISFEAVKKPGYSLQQYASGHKVQRRAVRQGDVGSRPDSDICERIHGTVKGNTIVRVRAQRERIESALLYAALKDTRAQAQREMRAARRARAVVLHPSQLR